MAAWLKAHPGVEVVSRDRSAAYAQAATEGASQAEQVADRWHLLKNLREAVERVLERHSTVVDAALKATETPTEPAQVAAVPEPGAATSPVESPPPRPPSEVLPESPRLPAEPSKRQKRIDRFEQVHELHRRGHSARRIAANWACHGGRCSATCGVRRARLGASGGRAGPDWTATGSGSTPASPRASRTSPSCTGS